MRYIYWLTVTYPKTLEVATRLVLIIDFEDGTPIIVSFATITGSEIQDFKGKYDRWKSPIFQWRQAGLDKQSFVKANNIATVEASVFKKSDFIGSLVRSDLMNALKKIEQFIESSEDSW